MSVVLKNLEILLEDNATSYAPSMILLRFSVLKIIRNVLSVGPTPVEKLSDDTLPVSDTNNLISVPSPSTTTSGSPNMFAALMVFLNTSCVSRNSTSGSGKVMSLSGGV